MRIDSSWIVGVVAAGVLITDQKADDPEGFARPEVDVHVPGDQRSLTVSDDFLRPDRLYQLEAIEDSGNQTIAVGFFRTE